MHTCSIHVTTYALSCRMKNCCSGGSLGLHSGVQSPPSPITGAPHALMGVCCGAAPRGAVQAARGSYHCHRASIPTSVLRVIQHLILV